jgi:hypothetical protein
VSLLAELAALVLALCSLLLGLVAVNVGLPDALSGAFSAKELESAALLMLGGAVLAAGLALQLPPIPGGETLGALGHPLRSATVAFAAMVVRADGQLRKWPVAGLWMVVLAAAFGWAMLTSGVRD